MKTHPITMPTTMTMMDDDDEQYLGEATLAKLRDSNLFADDDDDSDDDDDDTNDDAE